MNHNQAPGRYLEGTQQGKCYGEGSPFHFISKRRSSILSNCFLMSSTSDLVFMIVVRINSSFKSYSVLPITGAGNSFASCTSAFRSKYPRLTITAPPIIIPTVFNDRPTTVSSDISLFIATGLSKLF